MYWNLSKKMVEKGKEATNERGQYKTIDMHEGINFNRGTN